MARMFAIFFLCLQGGVLGLRLGTFGNANAPNLKLKASTGTLNTIIDGYNVNGPWNQVQYQCKTDELIDVQFDPVLFCKSGWGLLEKEHHPGKPCIVYDLGVRDRTPFAVHMLENFGCHVRSYDPSQTTSNWWANGDPKQDAFGLGKLKEFEKKGQYQLHKEAAGATDGDLVLYEYNWQQLGTFKASEQTKEIQKNFTVKSKTLQTMMKDHGDNFVDVMKIDIEGSEFPFLNAAFDKGCPPVEHILTEWHSTDMDMDYGAPPQVKEIETKMYKCGYKKYKIYPFFWQAPTREEQFDIKRTFYGHAAYCKNCAKPM